MGHLWSLDVTTFRGISAGAVHYYGTIKGRGEYRIEQMLTPERAAALTAADSGFTYQAGTWSNRFDTRAEIEAAALVAWRAVALDDDALVVGPSYSVGPRKPVAGPRQFVDIARVVWWCAEQLGWHDEPSTPECPWPIPPRTPEREAACDAIYRHWSLILSAYDLVDDLDRDAPIVLRFNEAARWGGERGVIAVEPSDGGWRICDPQEERYDDDVTGDLIDPAGSRGLPLGITLPDTFMVEDD